jgi:ABC-type phosphate transport system auxiliary subunit
MPNTPVPDYANLQKAARTGAAALKSLLDQEREHARQDDEHNRGRSRELCVLTAAEWGMAYGYLKALADNG